MCRLDGVNPMVRHSRDGGRSDNPLEVAHVNMIAPQTPAQRAPTAPDSRRQKIIYWLLSAPVLLETAAGIQWDFARNPTVVAAIDTIQFPDYFVDILGIAKCLALAALLVPRAARLKEWAYAGLVFVYFGAAACHLAVGDTVGAILTPFVFGLFAVASWALRPPSRRDPGPLDLAFPTRARLRSPAR